MIFSDSLKSLPTVDMEGRIGEISVDMAGKIVME